MSKKFLTLVGLLLAMTSIYFTETPSKPCFYNGKPHPEGTTIGPYECKDGKWVMS